MQFLFKIGGWLFIIIGGLLVSYNFDSLDTLTSSENEGNAYLGLVPLLVGLVQLVLGTVFVRLSKYMGQDGVGMGMLDRQKIEQRVMEVESRGGDATRMRALLDRMDSGPKQPPKPMQ